MNPSNTRLVFRRKGTLWHWTLLTFHGETIGSGSRGHRTKKEARADGHAQREVLMRRNT